MGSTWAESVRAFTEAADWFVTTVGGIGDRWQEPGLGEWDVRALVGHTSRALTTIENYLDRPASTVECESAVDYYRASRAIAASPAVTDRGREAGRALGEDPADAVATIAERVVTRVHHSDGSELVTTIVGGMRLGDYLVTRTFELTVHTADLATALDTPLIVPPTAGAQAFALVAGLAVRDGTAGPLLLAATGRRGLPEGYSLM